MSDKEITQGQDMTSKPDDEREEGTNEGDPEEDPTLSEEERLARRKRAKTAVKKGLVIVNTGKGKGKTTAAMGLLLRAWGQGLRVCMLQFIKARTAMERHAFFQALRDIGLKVMPSRTHFCLIEVGDAHHVRQQLLTRKILVRDGTSFGLPQFVRVTTRPMSDWQQLLLALQEIV